MDSEEYRREVLALAPSSCPPKAVRFQGTSEWWVKGGQLTPSDISRIKEIKQHRNQIAHELPKLLVDPSFDISQPLFVDMQRYITVLGRFWGRVAMEGDPQFDDQDIPDDQIATGSMLLVDHIATIVKSQDA